MRVGSRWPLPAALLIAAGLPWSAASAHLLNMTTVQVSVAPDGAVSVDLAIDLTRAVGGSLEYYRLSRISAPLESAEPRTLLGRLAAAVSVREPGGGAVSLALVSAVLPNATREVFLDPLSWPMSHVVLHGRLPAPATAVEAVFLPSFHFEEPIALTISETFGARRMTRWLVTSQVSPPFPLTQTGTNAGGPGSAPGSAQGAAATAPAPSLRQFVVFGFLHILPRGLDHVLFVLGLYLGARSLGSLLILVTCFTLAHSITLGLSSVGIIRLSPAIVEPLISGSIVWVGLENLLPASRAERYRPLIVFAFGLLHGLGFASALSSLDAPPERFLPSLVSFNVGIELGQLTVIGTALLLTFWCRRRSWYRRRVVLPASLLIAVVAGLWTVQRLQSNL